MRPKSIILLVLALGCGLAASIGISRVMDANANRNTPIDSTPIYVAMHNINLGDPIDPSMVSLQEFPTEMVPKGSIRTLDELEGRRPRTNIVAGTPILEAQLLAAGEATDPLAVIPDGFRLSTISVNAEKSAAGLLSPGDRVDVQLFIQANARAGVQTASSRVILQNVRVFAVEQAVQRAAEGDDGKPIPKTVSLLVKPDQAQRINLAQNLGELSLIPRNPNDELDAKISEITVSDLLGGRSDSNDRATEQNRDKSIGPKGPNLLDSVVGMMTKAAKSRPPFEMTIVQAEAVTKMRFDPRSGAPLEGEYEAYRSATTPATTVGLTQPGDTGTASSASGAEDTKSGEVPEDFPIDLEKIAEE